MSIGPFNMSSVNLVDAFNRFYRRHQFPKPDPASDENCMAGMDTGVAGGDIIFCQLSPLYMITLDTETKQAVSIPVAATHFAWSYPMVKDPGTPQNLLGRANEDAFLEYGGYVYFDGAQNVVGTNSINPAALGALGLMFGRAQILPPSVEESLTRQGRFQDITLNFLAQRGATHFAWIRPLEFSGRVASPDGCFAYKLSDGSSKYFPVVGRPIFTQDLLEKVLEGNEAWVVVRNRMPEVEVPVVFDKTKSFVDNIATNAHAETVADPRAVITVGKDSDDFPIPYAQWQATRDPGTIAGPWIVRTFLESGEGSTPAIAAQQQVTATVDGPSVELAAASPITLDGAASLAAPRGAQSQTAVALGVATPAEVLEFPVLIGPPVGLASASPITPGGAASRASPPGAQLLASAVSSPAVPTDTWWGRVWPFRKRRRVSE